MKIFLYATALAGLAASVAPAEAPRSAIPWLSESLLTAPDALPPIADTVAAPELTGGDEFGIIVTTLDAPIRDGVGVVTSVQTGLPADLWGPTSALRVRTLIATQVGSGVPSARNLFHTLLLAETNPPPGASGRNSVFLARVDRLMSEGLLEEAEALIEAAGISEPQVFRRAFDIGVLTDRTDGVCAALTETPSLSPTLPARIFCLARAGDWNAAALTLNLGLEIGDITAEEEAMLARFLDPELFEGEPAPPVPEPLTTLDFIIRDAVALPRPPGVLPLAFYHADLPDHQPMRARIEAGERLVREGAVPTNVLFAAYRAGKPAASGGIWDHAAAVQDLDRALDGELLGDIQASIRTADNMFSDIGLRRALAEEFAPELADLDPQSLSTEVRHRIYELLILAQRWQDATRFMTDRNDAADVFFRAMALPGTPFPDSPALSPLKRAAARGLTRPVPPGEDAARIAAKLDSGLLGEGILDSLELLSAGTEVDPGDLEAGLYLLRRAGLSDWARRIAAETLLLLPEA